MEATLGLVKRLGISKELIRECVTVPGSCCCMPLLHNHLIFLLSETLIEQDTYVIKKKNKKIGVA